jgi:hypothetical protein
MSATLQITDDMLLLDRWMPPEPMPTDPTQLVYLDIRSTRNPSTKGRGVRYRVACCTGWHLAFHCLWDKTVVNRNQFEQVILDAGQMVGLADGRSLGFGRFQLMDFQVSDGE